MTLTLSNPRRGEWWIEGLPPYVIDAGTDKQEGPYTTCGPYPNQQEANADRRGLVRAFKKLNRKGRVEP